MPEIGANVTTLLYEYMKTVCLVNFEASNISAMTLKRFRCQCYLRVQPKGELYTQGNICTTFTHIRVYIGMHAKLHLGSGSKFDMQQEATLTGYYEHIIYNSPL